MSLVYKKAREYATQKIFDVQQFVTGLFGRHRVKSRLN